MEYSYYFNYDCIHSVQNFEYLKFPYYFSLRLINKQFYFQAYPMFSLKFETSGDTDSMEKLNRFQSRYLTSLMIECKSFRMYKNEYNDIWSNMINLKALIIKSYHIFYRIHDHEIFTNLTYLKIQSAGNVTSYNCKNCTNVKYLNLRNVLVATDRDDSTYYFTKLSNLISFKRRFDKVSLMFSQVNLDYRNHSNLTYLKLIGVKHVGLTGMTQLKTKVFKNVARLTEN